VSPATSSFSSAASSGSRGAASPYPTAPAQSTISRIRPCAAPVAAGPADDARVPKCRSHDYVRAGPTTLFAALEVATGKVIGSLHRRHRAAEFKKFLAKLDKEVPAELQVHLILDNYATIKKWLLDHPRFHLHFAPTSASWLNLVERWFAKLTQKKLKRGVHRSVQALERDIRAWLAGWNEHPRSFVWTKTADEILDKVAAYCRRISDSDHQVY
jgi:transposase